MEDHVDYLAFLKKLPPAQPTDNPDIIGATAALKRAAAKAVARDLADGLEPVIRTLPDTKTDSPS